MIWFWINFAGVVKFVDLVLEELRFNADTGQLIAVPDVRDCPWMFPDSSLRLGVRQIVDLADFE